MRIDHPSDDIQLIITLVHIGKKGMMMTRWLIQYSTCVRVAAEKHDGINAGKKGIRFHHGTLFHSINFRYPFFAAVKNLASASFSEGGTKKLTEILVKKDANHLVVVSNPSES